MTGMWKDSPIEMLATGHPIWSRSELELAVAGAHFTQRLPGENGPGWDLREPGWLRCEADGQQDCRRKEIRDHRCILKFVSLFVHHMVYSGKAVKD
jgi:hypothetical protein